MPNPYRMKGFSGLYNAQRAEIGASMREAGASQDLLQRFTNSLDTEAHYTYLGANLTGRQAIFAMAREAMQRDPAAAAELARHPINSDEWRETVQHLFETLPVIVKYMPGPNVIDIMMGKGDAMLTVHTVG